MENSFLEENIEGPDLWGYEFRYAVFFKMAHLPPQVCGEDLSGKASVPFRSGRTPRHLCEVLGVTLICSGRRKLRLRQRAPKAVALAQDSSF